MAWIVAHWVEIAVIAGLLNALARRIVAWTPTEVDNAWLAWIVEVCKIIAGYIKPKGSEVVEALRTQELSIVKVEAGEPVKSFVAINALPPK